jgi:hypothetical protein
MGTPPWLLLPVNACLAIFVAGVLVGVAVVA